MESPVFQSSKASPRPGRLGDVPWWCLATLPRTQVLPDARGAGGCEGHTSEAGPGAPGAEWNSPSQELGLAWEARSGVPVRDPSLPGVISP